MTVNKVNSSQNDAPAKLNEAGDKYLGSARAVLKRVQQDISKVALSQGISRGMSSANSTKSEA